MLSPSAKLIHESAESLLYFQEMSEFDDTLVVIKILRNEFPEPAEVDKLTNDFEVTRHLEIMGIRKAYKLTRINNRYALFLKYFAGQTLKKRFEKPNSTMLLDFLSLAVEITQVVTDIHQENLIHANLSPVNILVGKKEDTIQIIDFGYASKVEKTGAINHSGRVHTNLGYIAPEQTGRTDQKISFGADLYALGATFYEILTRQPPFLDTDRMGLIHAHIARTPIAPNLLNAQIPEILSQIITKLLEKNAENRYRTAFGLRADLQKCLTALEQKGRIEPFKLGEEDISDEFHIPNKLYGRDKEVRVLTKTFESVRRGNKELVILAGEPGVGKSRLMHRVRQAVVTQKGYYSAGKFDKLHRDVPYSAWIQIFRSLTDEILRESTQSVTVWKKKLKEELGADLAIITEVVPNLRFLLDTPESLPKSRLLVESTKNRVKVAFQKFIETVARKEHPFVAFIDEFQWADSASLELFRTLLEGEGKYFLIIGAYRHKAVNTEHPFQQVLHDLRDIGLRSKILALGNLDKKAVGSIITDTLHCSEKYALSLIELVYSKTQGNAFFVHQFLTSLYEDNLLIFVRQVETQNGEKHAGRGTWKWDIARIQDLNITDNVVELLAKKIDRLEPDVQELLELGSCIGNHFNLRVLAKVYQRDEIETALKLLKALAIGLIFENKGRYKFAHVRIHQAVYMRMEEQKRKRLHLFIGHLFLKLYADQLEDKNSKRIFDVVNQLNQGRYFIDNQKERLVLAELNLQAGEVAKTTQAYRMAQTYLKTGLLLLPKEAWETHHELTFNLHKTHATTTYLIGNYQDFEVEIAEIIKRVDTPAEKAETYYILLLQYVRRGKYSKAIEVGKEALLEIGDEIPQENFAQLFEEKKQKLDTLFESHTIESLANLAPLTNTIQKIRLKILINSLHVSYLLGYNDLHVYWTLEAVQTTLEYGNSSLASGAYGNYGMILCSYFKEMKQGYQFAKLSCKLSDHYENQFMICSNYHLMANFVSPWNEHLKLSKFINDKAQEAAIVANTMPYVAYIRLFKLIRQFFQGTNLNKILVSIPKILELSTQHNHNWIADGVRTFDLIVQNLTGKTKQRFTFATPEIDEAQFLEKAQNSYSLSSVGYYQLLRAMVLYLYGDYGTAFRYICQAEKLIGMMNGMFLTVELYFYKSLILTALYYEIAASQQEEFLDELARNLEKLKFWSYHAPENFAARFYLVKAEQARILDKTEEAMNFYDKAITSAEENEYAQINALANELTSKFWMSKNKTKFASIYLKNAHFEYQMWGAVHKVNNLEENYSQYLQKATSRSREDFEENAYESSSLGAGSLDLFSIIKASQALAGEIVLSKALEKVIRIIIENAGAQRGLLVLPRNKRWMIEAEASTDDTQTNVLQSIPVDDVDGYTSTPLLSSEIVNYVIRTKKRLLLNDISNRGAFTGLQYVRKMKPKSVLCMPLFNQGKIGGILYLENRLITGAFTSDRLQVLKILSSQILISIQNATLYENLEEKVKERTAELDHKNKRMAIQALKLQATNDKLDGANKELDKKNKDVTASINYAKRIQEAMLPQLSKVEKAFEEAFVFFRPRDIVSGDFYWFSEKNNKVIISAIDCTGHGVPGAFMSLIGNDSLNEIVNLLNITEANEILSRLHREVTKSLKQSETSNRDGMDMALCVIDYEKQILEFAGAKNPLVWSKNGELIEIQGDRFPVGSVRKMEQLERKFTKHRIPLDKEATYYIFSDGYQDQFGGKEGKKLMKKRFKKLLLDISEQPLTQQKQILENHFTNWINGYRQIDDVLVIGFRV